MNTDRYYQDITVRDTVEIIESEDADLIEWCENNGYIHFITNIEDESGLVWIQDCPYGIAMADIVKIECNKL